MSADASLANRHPSLNKLAKTIRSRRLFRGSLICFTVAVALLSLVFVIYSIFGLSNIALRWGLAVWIALCAFSVLIGLATPLLRRISTRALAGRMEQVYPDLAERLSTASDLPTGDGESGPIHRLFLRDIETRVNDVEVNKVVNRGRSTPWVVVAGVSLLSVGATFAFSDEFRQFTGRFFCLSDPKEGMPSPDGETPYAIRLQQAHVRVQPPAYTNPLVHKEATTKLPAKHSALQYGQIQYELEADRSFTKGRLELAPTAGGTRLSFSISGNEAQKKSLVRLPQIRPGIYRVTASFQSSCRSWSKPAALGRIVVRPDSQPEITSAGRFGSILPDQKETADTDKLPSLSATDYLTVAVEVRDREGVERIELEYSINNGPRRTMVLADGDGRLVIGCDSSVSLKETGAKNGDAVRYRIKAIDNRRVPARLFVDADGRRVPTVNLTPQIAFDPPVVNTDRWYAFRIKSGSNSFDRQMVVAQNEWLKKQLAAVRKALRTEQKGVQHLHDELKSSEFSDKEKQALEAIQTKHAETQDTLLKLAEGLENTFPLEEFGKDTRDVVGKELKPTGNALKNLPNNAKNDRSEKFDTIDKHLSRAHQRLLELEQKADQLSKNLLDQLDLVELASKEEQLAKKAEELAKKKRSGDAGKREFDKLQDQQKKIRAKMDAMAAKSELVKKAIDAARSKQLQQIAENAEQLALKQEAMNANRSKSSANAEATLLEQIIRDQKKIVRESVAKGRSADDKSLTVQPGNQAVKDLEAYEIKQALESQLAFGRNLQKWVEQIAPNAKKTAHAADVHALAKQQSKVLSDLKSFSKEFVKYPPLEFDKKIAALKSQQTSVKRRMDAMWASLADAGPKTLLKKVRSGVGHATIFMDRNDFLRATLHMKIGIEALREVAEKTPPVDVEPLPENATGKEKLAHSVRKLAARQFALRDKTAQLLSAMEQKDGINAMQMKQQAEHAAKTAKVAKELHEMAQQTSNGNGKKELANAAKSAKDAEAAMKKIEQQMRKKDFSAAKDSGKQSVELLKKTSSLAMKTALKMMRDPKNAKASNAGMEFKQSQKQMQEAEKHLAKGNVRQAKSAMQNAAQALRRAAEKSLPRHARSSKPGTPNENGKKPNRNAGGNQGPLSVKEISDLMNGKNGKWGELSGKLRTELVQVMRARYGDDYAQIIQRYFQQIADVPIKDRTKDE